MNNLENQIKELIIDSLGLEDITPADIGSEDPLFGDEGLGLDSVDALELGLAVQKTFGFQLDGENDNLRDNFANVKTLAEFVKSRQAERRSDMTEQEVRTLLTDALVNLFEIEPERIKPETNLYEDLEIDSIDAIDLIDHIKRETGRKLQAEDFRNVRTVEDVVQAVLKVQAQDS